jgi:hypothetical protein
MWTNQRDSILVSSLLLACTSQGRAASDASTEIGTLDAESAGKIYATKRPYSPWAGRPFPTRPSFGDTHLHTSY